MSPAEITTSLNALAGTSGETDVGAANAWAGMTGEELIGALNAKAGNDGTTAAKAPRELNGVCNQLNGSTGLEAQAALSQLAGLG